MFIYDNTALPATKSDLEPLPDGADPTKWVAAIDWNTVSNAVGDVKTWARGALWMGLTESSSDPAPSGVAKYFWLKTDGTLWLTVDGVATQLGANSKSPQTARYTATGSEGSSFLITLSSLTPAIAVTDTNYNAIVTCGGIANSGDTYTFDVPVGQYTTSHIRVLSSQPVQSGDVLIVQICPF